MADNILRLRVDSQEYDAKLKKAAEGIRHLADVAHQGGGELTGLEKAELDYVKALGSMETKSRTAAGSVRELESTYKELKVIYDQLNDVEKADEGGKALAASLEQIKQRAQEARTQLENASKSLSDNGQEAQQSSSTLDALASKFTINIDALKLFNVGLKAAKGALDVAKDAFMSSEANVDEWGRVMDSSKSLYEGFLTALNTGDISGYLSRIDSIVQAARTAYNELDRLGTMKTIQAPQMSAQQTENERIRSMIQTGRYIAPIDGRRNAVFNGREMQSGDKLTAGQIRALERQLQNGMQKLVTLVGNEVRQTGKAIDAVYNRQAKELGMDLSEFRKGTSSMAEFDKRMAGYDQYQKWRNENYYTDNWGNRRVKEGNPFEEFKKWGTFRVDGERYNDLIRLIQQRDQQAGQAYGMQSQSYRAMNRAEGFTVSKLMKGDKGGNGGKTIKEEKDDFVEINGLINMATERVNDLQKRIREAPTESMITELRDQLKDAQAELDRLNGKEVKIQMETGTSIQNNAGMSAYIASIKQQLETADYGTSLYNGLSAQLADMTTLQNLVGESLKAGLGTAMFDAADATGKDFWTRAMEGGVDNIDWQSIVDKINEARKAAGLDDISLDSASGSVSTKPDKKKESPMDGTKKMLNAISQLTNGLQQIGIELPAEIQGVISVIQGVTSVIEAVNTIIGITQASELTANTVAMGLLTEALWANTATSWIPFANGGIVPGFANGGVIDSGHSPAFLSFSKAAPAFATGGVVPQTITSIPKFATGGIIQKFNEGGTVEAGHAPDFLSFSKAMPKFATGGTIPHANSGYFVGGTHFSGDVTPIMANAGELVLNKAQQGNLANQLQGGGMQNLNLTATIKGEQIRLALNNNGRRTGRGEYVQSSNRV